jgi:integrase
MASTRGRKIDGFNLFQRAGSKQWTLAYQVTPGKWAQHRVPTEITGKASARAYALSWLAQQRTDLRLPAGRGSGYTVRGAYPLWAALREANPSVRKSTWSDNKSHFKNHVLPVLGDLRIDTIDAQALRSWLRGLVAKGIAPRTVHHVMSTVSSFLDDAVAERWTTLQANPGKLDAVRSQLPAVHPDPQPHLEMEQAERLVQHEAIPADRSLRYLIGFLTGMRDGEISGGSWADLDLDNEIPIWHVRRACAIRGEDGNASLGLPKTHGSVRKVPLHPVLVARLKAWRDEGYELFVGQTPQPHRPVLPSPRGGGHWRPKSAKWMRHDLALCGLPTALDGADVDFHATRRSFCTWLDEADVQQHVIGRLLGHRDKNVTSEAYTARVLRRLHEAVCKLEFGARLGAERHTADASAGQEPAKNTTESADSAPVAQWIEQRFPNAICDSAPDDISGASAQIVAAYDALADGATSQQARRIMARAQRSHHERATADLAAERRRADAVRHLEATLTMALDRSATADERRARMVAGLAAAADLLTGTG